MKPAYKVERNTKIAEGELKHVVSIKRVLTETFPPSSYDEQGEVAFFQDVCSAKMYAEDIINDEGKNEAAIVAAEIVPLAKSANGRTVQFSIRRVKNMDLATSELLGLYNKSYGTHFASLLDARDHTPLRVNISNEAAIETRDGAAVYRALPVSIEFYNFLDIN